MENKIKKYLGALEKENNIKILLACETGSRAWGFASPDSDFDVRLIYTHSKDWYLSLSEKPDTIELMLENREIDISGWDLRKTLRLMSKSNASIIERIQSPFIYHADDLFLNDFSLLVTKTYSRIATIHHYLSMAKNALSEIENKEQIKLKRLFYALRAASVCRWICQKQEIPPIVFLHILEGLSFDTMLKRRIYELISLKARVSESYFHPYEADLIDYINQSLLIAQEESQSLPPAKFIMSDLDDFFIETINRYDH